MATAVPRSDINWSAAARAGMIGGAVFLALDLMLTPLSGGSGTGTPRLTAAIVLGDKVLSPAAPILPSVILVGLIVHAVLSILYGLTISALVHRTNLATASLLGSIAGLGLYVLNFYVFTSVFPWFATARTWVTVLVHLVFGFAVAGSYTLMTPLAPQRSRTW
jgi:hypothetical protein